jgi:hypothetical protein
MRCLGIALVASLTWSGFVHGQAEAGGPIWPGSREDQRAPLSSTRPDRLREVSHHGWTVKSEHFVVVATTSQADAAWAAEEFERTWTAIGRLADQWTQTHRQPGFGQQEVSVVVTQVPRHPKSTPTTGPTFNPGPDIYVNLSDGSASLEDRLPQMRSEVFAAFLRVCRHEMLMPEWVQVGLAAYFSDQVAPEAPFGTLEPPAPFLPPTKGAWARRVMLGPGSVSIENPQQAAEAALWVRYLLEGDDAQYADQFFTALSTTLAQGTRDRLSSTEKARGVAPRRPEPSPPEPVNWNRLTRDRVGSREIADWLADPNVGQPLVETSPQELPLDERCREIVLILKLAKRFSAVAGTSIEPKVFEYRAKPSDDATASPEEPLNIAALHQQLTDPAMPRWATIDTNGRLLLSSDRERLAAIFTNPDRTYRTYSRDGHLVLEASFQSGEVLESWLEENPANPKRPIARVCQKPAEQLPTEKKPAEQSASRVDVILRVVR